MDVVNHRATTESSVNSRAVPGIESFVRSQRDPTHVAESEADSNANSRSAPSEKAHQRRMPIVSRQNGTRIPAPAEVIDPHPAPALVRRPTRVYLWNPHITVLRIIGPAAIWIQVFSAIYIAAHIPWARGAPE